MPVQRRNSSQRKRGFLEHEKFFSLGLLLLHNGLKYFLKGLALEFSLNISILITYFCCIKWWVSSFGLLQIELEMNLIENVNELENGASKLQFPFRKRFDPFSAGCLLSMESWICEAQTTSFGIEALQVRIFLLQSFQKS